MKRSVPKMLSKRFTGKSLKRKILKRIHVPKDRQWVESLFSEDDTGKLKITSELTDEQKKRLKGLAKAIKKNRGIFTAWKTIPLLVILAGILVFNIFFRDSLVEKGVESALQGLFQAQVDLKGVHLSLLKGEFSFNSLTIADKDNPMNNLLETGTGAVGIDMPQLLYKRFHIEEISLTDVRWNTNRTESGALAPKEETPAEEKKQSSSTSIDYRKLITDHTGDLASLTLVMGLNARTESFRDEWSGRFDGETQKVADLEKQFEDLKNIDVSRLSSPADVAKVLNQLASVKDKTAELRSGVQDLGQQFNTDKAALAKEGGSVTSLIGSDVDTLAENLNFGSGNFKTLASGLAESYIQSRWNSYYSAGLKGWNLYRKFNSNKKVKKEKKGLNRAQGRTIAFPSPSYPAFLADKLKLTGSDDSLGKFDIELSRLSSDPDKTDGPMDLAVNLSGEKGNFTGNGILDLRSGSDRLFQMDLKGTGLSFVYPGGIPALEISRFSSQADLQGRILSEKDNTVLAQTDIKLSNLNIEQQGSTGFLHDAVKTVFEKNKTIGLNSRIKVNSRGIYSVSVDTDFDRILNNSIGEYMNQLKSRAESELRKALEEFLAPSLKDRDSLLAGLDKLGLQSTTQMTALSNIDSGISNKKKELEAKAASFTSSSGILDKAKDSIKIPGF